MKTVLKKYLSSYLNYWAMSAYRRFKPYVIGITGSSGKTTTKYFISQLLKSADKKTYLSATNLNTRFGLPLAILLIDNAPKNIIGWFAIVLLVPLKAILLKNYPDYLVLEYAADSPGDIKKLTELVSPEIAVITTLGVAHIEIFKNEQKIIDEKSELAEASKEYVIVPAKVYKKIKGKKITARVVIAEQVPFLRFENIKQNTKGTDLTIVLNEKKYKKTFSFAGEHNIDNLRLSILAAYYAGAGRKLVEGIEKLGPLPGRGRRIIGKKEIMIIDESYNANPESMYAALQNLNNIKYGRKVAILGEMKEISPISSKAHLEISTVATKLADVVIGVGAGFKECKLDKWYPNVRELKGEIEDILIKGDVVLLKGSRSNKLEEAIELIK